MDSGTWQMCLMALAFGYLLGSIPFGLLLTRLSGRGDIRRIGSGNIGATNVLRTGSKGLAAGTLLLDGAKGAAAVLIAEKLFGANAGLAAGLGAFLGHLFPVWLNFNGGKGISTYIGVLAALVWPAAVAFCLVWLAMALAFRISSLAALVASLCAPLAAIFWGGPSVGTIAAVMTALTFLRHSSNIRRLLAGEEPRIGGKAR